MSSSRNLVLTGYGPFGEHDVNVSWLAVQEAQRLWKEEDKEKKVDVSLHCEELPVSYDHVQVRVPGCWSRLDPVALIHVGVSGQDNQMRLETCARNQGYNRPDVKGKCPQGGICLPTSTEVLNTKFDVQALVSKVTASGSNVACSSSQDAGRYLCEYVLFKSLSCVDGRALFLHVPPQDRPYSVQQLGQAIVAVLEGVIEQVDTAAAIDITL